MQIHQIKPIHKPRKRKRVGRGGKRGTYSGRGIKGQKARAGRKLAPFIRELIKRYPKLRGYRQEILRKKVAIVNIGVLEEKFESGEVITPEGLIKKGIIRNIKGRGPRGYPKVKILGKGKLTKTLTIENCLVSKSAKEKIEKVEGKIR